MIILSSKLRGIVERYGNHRPSRDDVDLVTRIVDSFFTFDGESRIEMKQIRVVICDDLIGGIQVPQDWLDTDVVVVTVASQRIIKARLRRWDSVGILLDINPTKRIEFFVPWTNIIEVSRDTSSESIEET